MVIQSKSMNSMEHPPQIHEIRRKSSPDPRKSIRDPSSLSEKGDAGWKVSLLIDVDTMDTTRPLEVHEIHKEKKAQDLTRQPAERSADNIL